jgi:hypothetical protein
MRQKTVSITRRSNDQKPAPLTNLTSSVHAEDSARSVIGPQHGLNELAERTLCVVRKLVDILVRSSNAPREPNFAFPARLAATVTRNRVPKACPSLLQRASGVHVRLLVSADTPPWLDKSLWGDDSIGPIDSYQDKGRCNTDR